MIRFDIRTAIMRDIMENRPPAESKVRYNAERLAYRADVQAELDAARAENPDAQLDIPIGLEGLPD